MVTDLSSPLLKVEVWRGGNIYFFIFIFTLFCIWINALSTVHCLGHLVLLYNTLYYYRSHSKKSLQPIICPVQTHGMYKQKQHFLVKIVCYLCLYETQVIHIGEKSILMEKKKNHDKAVLIAMGFVYDFFFFSRNRIFSRNRRNKGQTAKGHSLYYKGNCV